MTTLTEVEALATLDQTLAALEDPSTRNRVLEWAWSKYSTSGLSRSDGKPLDEKPNGKKVLAKPKKKTGKKLPRPTLTIVKELNLRPQGRQTFKEFATEKQPRSNNEKCTIAVYYLQHVLGAEAINVNHVYTCYKEAGNWKVPNIANILPLTASRKGWLDTSDMKNIKVTTPGENLVNFDLPKKDKTA